MQVTQKSITQKYSDLKSLKSLTVLYYSELKSLKSLAVLYYSDLKSLKSLGASDSKVNYPEVYLYAEVRLGTH